MNVTFITIYRLLLYFCDLHLMNDNKVIQFVLYVFIYIYYIKDTTLDTFIEY